MIVLIDNYDSFTFNLAQYFRTLGAEPVVIRNDAESVDAVMGRQPTGIVISPGPGSPDAAGLSLDIIAAAAAASVPVLGVCLGHQAIARHFGGRIVRAPTVMHGKTSSISHDGAGVFSGLPSPFTATRYHSLAVAPDSVPESLAVTAWSVDEAPVIMGLRHRTLPIEGVQFHPEAILTEHGHALLGSFLDRASAWRRREIDRP